MVVVLVEVMWGGVCETAAPHQGIQGHCVSLSFERALALDALPAHCQVHDRSGTNTV